MVPTHSDAQNSNFAFPLDVEDPVQIADLKAFDAESKMQSKKLQELVTACAGNDKSKFQDCLCKYKANWEASKKLLTDMVAKYPAFVEGDAKKAGVSYHTDQGISTINFVVLQRMFDKDNLLMDKCS